MTIPYLALGSLEVSDHDGVTDYRLISASFPAPALRSEPASALERGGIVTGDPHENAVRTIVVDCTGSGEEDAAGHANALSRALVPGTLLYLRGSASGSLYSTRILRASVVEDSYEKLKRDQGRLRVTAAIVTDPYWDGSSVTVSGTVTSGLGYVSASGVTGDVPAKTKVRLTSSQTGSSGFTYAVGCCSVPTTSGTVLTATAGSAIVYSGDPPVVVPITLSGGGDVTVGTPAYTGQPGAEDFVTTTYSLAVGTNTWAALMPSSTGLLVASSLPAQTDMWVLETGSYAMSGSTISATHAPTVYSPVRIPPGDSRVYIACGGPSAHGNVTVEATYWPRFLVV